MKISKLLQNSLKSEYFSARVSFSGPKGGVKCCVSWLMLGHPRIFFFLFFSLWFLCRHCFMWFPTVCKGGVHFHFEGANVFDCICLVLPLTHRESYQCMPPHLNFSAFFSHFLRNRKPRKASFQRPEHYDWKQIPWKTV